MKIALQIISNDQTVRSNSVKDIKDFNSQTPATQTKNGEKLVSKMPAIKKALDLVADDKADLSSKKYSFKKK